ncbi:hypothetical protein J6590_086422, partial [Homalodisca vitripennis]
VLIGFNEFHATTLLLYLIEPQRPKALLHNDARCNRTNYDVALSHANVTVIDTLRLAFWCHSSHIIALLPFYC